MVCPPPQSGALDLPKPLLTSAFVQLGLDKQGLFRVPGSASQVKLIKENYLKAKKKFIELNELDVHTVCSLLTDFLRSEEPLLTYKLAGNWIAAASTSPHPLPKHLQNLEGI